MRASHALPLVLALVAASSSVAAQSGRGPRVPSVKGRIGDLFRPERRTTVTTVELASMATAPTAPLLDDSKQPTTLPGALSEATDIQFVSGEPSSLAKWRASRSPQPIYGRLEVEGGSVRMARDVQSGVVRGQLSLSCYNNTNGYNPGRAVALRWERIVPPAAPGQPATLHTSDGWFDTGSCRAYVERRQTAPLAVAGSFDGTPVVFASRSDEGLTLYFPPTARVAADTTAGVSSPTAGALWRVLVPVRRGLAASVLAELTPAAAASWMAQLAGPAPTPAVAVPARPGSSRAIQVGVDVVQAVRDEQPTVLVRITG